MERVLTGPVPAAAITPHCCSCDRAVEHRLLEHAVRISVLGRPVISTGHTYWLSCTGCAATSEITERQKKHLLRYLARTRAVRTSRS
jgi:hypothetical protein